MPKKTKERAKENHSKQLCMSILHGKGQLNLKNCRKELRINLNIQRQALKIIQRNLVYESDH